MAANGLNLLSLPREALAMHAWPHLSPQDVLACTETCKALCNEFRDPTVLRQIWRQQFPQSVDSDFPTRPAGESDRDYKTRCWRAQVGLAHPACSSQTLARHRYQVSSVAFAPDGRIATGSFDCTARVYSPEGALLQTHRGHKSVVASVAFAPDGRLATASSDRTARVYSPEGALLQTHRGHKSEVTSVAFAPDGRLATGSWDNTARVYSPEGVFLFELTGDGGTDVSPIAFAPDGRIAINSDDGKVRVYSPEGVFLLELTGHTCGVSSIAFAPDGRLATASHDCTARVYSPEGVFLFLLERTGRKNQILSVAFAPDGRLATASSDGTARVYSPEGKLLCTLTNHTSAVSSVAFALDGRLATGSYDCTAKVWDLSAKHDKVVQEIAKQLAGEDERLNSDRNAQFAGVPRQMRMTISDELYCMLRPPITCRSKSGWADTGWPRLIEELNPTDLQRAEAIRRCLPRLEMDAVDRLKQRILDRIYCLADVAPLSSVYFRCEPGILSCEQHTMYIQVGPKPAQALQMLWRPNVQVKNKHGRLVGAPRPGWVLPANIQVDPGALSEPSWECQFFEDNDDKRQIGTCEFRRFTIPEYAFEDCSGSDSDDEAGPASEAASEARSRSEDESASASAALSESASGSRSASDS